jgi:hypothetical protein
VEKLRGKNLRNRSKKLKRLWREYDDHRDYTMNESESHPALAVGSAKKGVAVSADSSTDLERLESTFRRLLLALQSFAPVASWVDNAHERSQCESAYHELCGLAAELDLPSVPSIDFPPVDGRAAGLAIARWGCEAFGCLQGRSRKTECSRRKTGRPRKGETDKERLVIAALTKHHDLEGRSVGNYEPAKTRTLAKLASSKRVSVSVATVSRFFKQKFPDRGYKGYENACRNEKIGKLLAYWNGDLNEHRPDLLPHEYGRGEDD